MVSRWDEAPTASLEANEVHLCLSFFNDPSLDAMLARYRGLLNASELDQADRFHFEVDRRRHLVTRALLRCTLSRYAPATPPTSWRFEVNGHGRPRIASGHGLTAPLDFNLTHTRGVIALAISRLGEVGVDAEDVISRRNMVHLARHQFVPAETEALLALPSERQQARFFEHWTLKEAYVKARGQGLSIPLDRFSFDLGDPACIDFAADAALDPEPGQRAFWQWSLGDGHLLALCAPMQGGLPPRVRLSRVQPLLSWEVWGLAPTRCSHPSAPQALR